MSLKRLVLPLAGLGYDHGRDATPRGGCPAHARAAMSQLVVEI